MKLIRLSAFVVLGLAASLSQYGHAEDIDLFAGSPAGASGLPNVLFIVDNTANWGSGNNPQPFTNEKAALVNTFQNLPVNADGSAKFNVGVLFSAETGQNDNNVSGGVVRAAMRPMTAANKLIYANLFDSLDSNDDKGNGGVASLMMAEAFRYFAGQAPYAGNNKAKADFTGNTCQGCNQLTNTNKGLNAAVWNLAGNALSSKNGTVYTPPTGDNCGNNFIIFLSNGPSQDNNSAVTQANNMLTAAGGSTTTIPLSPSGSQGNPSDEWARFMKESSLGITTFTIDVNPGTTGQGPGWTAVLKSMASISGGEYTAVSSSAGAGAEISDAINNALSQIQAVNSVFASVSLPVSVNTQGTYLNQVFVGQFRPDPNRNPRWNGNLKQYKMAMVSNTLRLVDANDNAAINPLTGFITECARSYWTPSSVPGGAAGTYWSFDTSNKGLCLTVPNSEYSDFPDGSIVERGAQAYRLRQGSASTRVAKTTSAASCINNTCPALTDFNSANASVTLAGVAAGDRTGVINWVRGQDVLNENGNASTTEQRPYVHGDVVHSRPVAIDYGNAGGNPRIAVFYGANDGMLRAINGNRSENFGSSTLAAGDELWSFMPPEFYDKVKRIYDNDEKVQIKGFDGGTPKPYGMDGNITAYQEGSTALIFAGMRRGGRAFYAFDVSNPLNPSLKWKVGCPNMANDTGCATGYSDIGQTWASAISFKSSGYTVSGSNAPMLIMGGGYDTCEDGDPNTCTGSFKGNRIYVIDVGTGALLKSFTTDRGVVGDVSLVRDANGMAQYGYAADMGGNLYRISMGNDAPSAWTMVKIASLGCSTPTANCTDHRKFLYGPDVVREGDVFYLMIGSGDREKPLSTYANAASVSNYFFVVKDKPTEATWLTSQSGTCAATNVMCLASLLPISSNATPSTADLDAKRGWYLSLSSQEQVVTSAITVLGTVTFSTHSPISAAQQNVCSANLGTARVYNLAYLNAASKNGTSSRFETLPKGGLSPSPVAGQVTLDNGETVIFVIGSSKNSPLEATKPPPLSSTPAQPTKRVYWNIKK